MARVVASLEPHDALRRLGQPVDDLAFSLVAPLGADDYYVLAHVAYRKVFGPEIPGQPVKTIRSQPRSHGYRIALAFYIPLSATNSRSTLNSSIWWPCPGKTWTTITPASHKARTASTRNRKSVVAGKRGQVR